MQSDSRANLVRVLRRAVPQRSLPPCGPLVGEGQGDGWLQAPNLREHRNLSTTTAASRLSCNREIANTVLDERGRRTRHLRPPLSLSLPHKGGGNVAARAFAH